MSGPSGRVPPTPLTMLLLVVAALGLGCRQEPRGRVLLVGLDGASPVLTESLLRQGRLPTLGRLAREGASGEVLAAVRPLASPVIWNTVVTGRRPRGHGITGFVRSEAGRRRLFDSRDRRAPALWTIASRAGYSVGVVNWWTTFPPEIVNGVVVSDHAVVGNLEEVAELFQGEKPSRAGWVAYPPEWSHRAREILAREPAPGEPRDPFAGATWLPDETIVPRLSEKLRRDVAVVRVARAVEEELRPDLALVLLSTIDRASHLLWHYVEPDADYPESLRPDPGDVARGRALVEEAYQRMDALLARLLDPYDLERDLVVVLSDHGFEPDADLRLGTTGNHRSARAARGVAFVAGAGVSAGARVVRARTLDVTPTVLTWLGLPVGRDMNGRALSELFPDDPHFLDPPAAVATHDEGPVRFLEGEASGVEQSIEEELRALGYVE